MFDFVSNLDRVISGETFFWFCALAGTGMFVVQMVLMMLGVGDHDDADDFRWFSKQALIGFLMMFGWVALTCRNEFMMGRGLSGLIACGGGTVAMVCTGLLFKWAKKLRSPGNVFRIEDAIGKEAVIYQRIPKGGSGKISISLNHLTHELDAVSLDEELPSFTQVKVINTANEKTVVVVPIK